MGKFQTPIITIITYLFGASNYYASQEVVDSYYHP